MVLCHIISQQKLGFHMVSFELNKTVCKSWSQKQIMWFPSGGLHNLCLGARFWTVWTRACCIYIRAAFSYIISVEKVSFSSFFQGTASFSQSHGGAILKHGGKVWQCYWENEPMCGTDCYQVNDLERSAHGMNGLRSPGFCGQFHRSFWGRLGAEKNC